MELNKSYLIKSTLTFDMPIQKIVVEEVTKLCFKVRFENNHRTWFEYDDFGKKYYVIEDLGFQGQ